MLEEIPDADHMYEDEQERIWYRFALTFRDQHGQPFAASLWALSEDDAETRVRHMKKSLKIEGQVLSTHPE